MCRSYKGFIFEVYVGVTWIIIYTSFFFVMHLNCIITAFSPILPFQIADKFMLNGRKMYRNIPRYTTGESYKFKRKIVQMLQIKNVCIYEEKKHTSPPSFSPQTIPDFTDLNEHGLRNLHFHSQLDPCLGLL